MSAEVFDLIANDDTSDDTDGRGFCMLIAMARDGELLSIVNDG